MKTRFSLLVFVSVLLLLASVLPAAAVEAPGVFENSGFEVPISSGWTVSNAVGDKRICNSTAPLPSEGTCMFRFKGGTGKTVLKQNVSAAGLQTLNNSTACYFVFMGVEFDYYPSSALAAGTTVRLMTKFTSNDGDYQFKVVSRLTDFTVGAWNTWFHDSLTVPFGADVNALSINIQHSAPGGKLFVDNLKLDIREESPRAC